MKSIVFLAVSLLFAFTTHANNPPLGGWFMYFGNMKFERSKENQSNSESSKWNLNYDVQNRNNNFVSDLNQMLIRGSIQYTWFNNLTLGSGYAFVHSEQFEKPDNPFGENRIFQDVVTNQQIATATIKHRFRFEQRFIENQNFKSRFRYQLGLDIPLYKNYAKEQNVYATVYNEIFMNTDQATRKTKPFDRNRLYFGAGFKVNPNLAFQLGYMNQMLQNVSYQQMMISLHHNLKIY